MSYNLTVGEVEELWREAKKKRDGLRKYGRESLFVNRTMRLCIAYAEERRYRAMQKLNQSEGTDEIAGEEYNQWQSALNRMKGE